MNEEDLTPAQREAWISVNNALWERKKKLGKQIDRFSEKKCPAFLEKDYLDTVHAEGWILKNPTADWSTVPAEYVESVRKAIELVKQRLTNEVNELASLLEKFPTV